MKIKYCPDKVWKPFYNSNWDIAVLIGGRGSGKTWNAGNFACLKTFEDLNYRTLVLRDVGSSINQSILQNIKSRFTEIDIQLNNTYKNFIIVQENQVKNHNGEVLVLTKGFRTSRVEQQTDLKGFEDIDLAIIEEAEDIRDEERVNTLLDTLRKKGHKVILILNTPDLEHWIIKRFFDFEKTETDGFFKLIPKQIKGVCQVITSYKNNKHLPKKTVEKYSSYNNPDSYNYNPEYYKRAILGLATERRNVLRKFDINKIKNLPLKDPIRIIEGVKQFKEIEQGKIYSIGVDTSSGHGKDFTGITIREQSQNFPVVFQSKLKTSEVQTANIVQMLWSTIMQSGGVGFIAVERNEATGGDVNRILLERIDNRYFYRRYIKDPNDLRGVNNIRMDFGWKTTNTTRQTIITDFGILFNQNEIEICNKEEADEMLTFVWNDDKKRYEHLENEHDDLLFSDFICLANFQYINKYGVR
jgi:hypothetical protein